jgi:hypothetical protein
MGFGTATGVTQVPVQQSEIKNTWLHLAATVLTEPIFLRIPAETL